MGKHKFIQTKCHYKKLLFKNFSSDLKTTEKIIYITTEVNMGAMNTILQCNLLIIVSGC